VSTIISVLYLRQVLKDVLKAGSWLCCCCFRAGDTRLEACALLNLKVFGKKVLDLHVEHKYAIFLGPQLAILHSACTTLQEEADGPPFLGLRDRTWLQISISFTIISLAYGLLSKLITSVYVSAEGDARLQSARSHAGSTSSKADYGQVSGRDLEMDEMAFDGNVSSATVAENKQL